MKKSLATAVATFLAISLSIAGEASPEQIGLPVGKPAPKFTLRDQNDKEVSLDQLLKRGPVAVVFVRSADWCLYCKMQLSQLQRNLNQIEATGGLVVSVSYDSNAKLKRFANLRKITFPMLSDIGSKTIDAYGMRDKESQGGSANHGTFIIDRHGIICAKPLILNYADQPAMDALLNGLKMAQNEKRETKP
jgi:peroxiredoxin